MAEKSINGEPAMEMPNIPVYPGNSFKEREERAKAAEEAKANAEAAKTPKTTIVAKAKPKSKAKKILMAIIGEDIPDIRDYVLYSVIIPTGKRAIMDLVSSILRVDPTPGASRGILSSFAPPQNRVGGTRVSYQSYYDDRQRRGGTNGYQANSPRSVFTFDNIYVDTMDGAQETLNLLNDILSTSGVARVSDLFEIVGLNYPFTYRNWGWFSLYGATYRLTEDGYLLILPPAVAVGNR